MKSPLLRCIHGGTLFNNEAFFMQRTVRYMSSPSARPSGFDVSSSSLAVKTLQKYGIKNPKLLEKVNTTPGVSGVDPNAWKNVLTTFGNYGLSPPAVASIVIKNPKLLTLSQGRLSEAWRDWLNCCHENQFVRDLIMAHPELLNLGTEHIQCRYNHIKAIVGSHKFSMYVLLRCPQIMYTGLSDLEDVSDYISERMIVRNVAEYYKSTALGRSLHEIMTRHIFLERCGKYKTPNLKQSDKIPSSNPTLMDIYDTSAEDFATKFAGVTLEEFVVFQSLYDNECKNSRGTDVESDVDSDSDS